MGALPPIGESAPHSCHTARATIRARDGPSKLLRECRLHQLFRLAYVYGRHACRRGCCRGPGDALDAAIQLEVDNELLIERLAGRAKAEGRADDNPESVRKRLEVYDAQTAPVIEFYRQQGQLTVVDGVGTLDEVFGRIIEAISPGKAVG